MTVDLWISLGFPQVFRRRETLEAKLSNLIETLTNLQEWSLLLRFNALQNLVNNITIADKDFDGATLNRSSLVAASIIRSRYFGPSSALSTYAALPSHALGDFEARELFSTLFAINVFLWEFRDNEISTIKFLVDLSHTVNMSPPTTFPFRPPATRLPSLIMILVLGYGSAKLNGKQVPPKSFLICIEEIIEFVELVMMASPQARHMILSALSSWLTATVSWAEDFYQLHSADMQFLKMDIRNGWLEERRKWQLH